MHSGASQNSNTTDAEPEEEKNGAYESEWFVS